MSLGVEVDERQRELVVSFGGLDAAMALTRQVHVPFDAITGARVAPVSDLRADRGWRTGGTYWPGRVAAGRYSFTGRSGARQLWLVFRDPEVLVIDTTLARPARIVLQTPERAKLARQLDALAAGGQP